MRPFFSLLLLVAAIFLLFAAAATAADVNGDGRELILLPLAFSPGGTIPGAFGSVWSGDVWIENRNSSSVRVYPCYLPYMCGEFGPGAVGRFSNPEFYYPDRGVLFDVPADQAKKLTFSNRIYELTLRAQPRGIEIPVVREGAFFVSEQTFLGVPAEAVRVSLRIYDPWIWHRVYRIPIPGPALEGVTVEVINQMQSSIGSTTLRPALKSAGVQPPGFEAIHNLATVAPAMEREEYVHIRVTPIPAGAQYWAMASVTDNRTQAVSIITAQ